MFHYISCGLEYIWLKNGYTTIDTSYGESTSIHDIEGLHKIIGHYLVNNVPQLSGSEIRFLRKELDLSQVDLSNSLKVSESTVRAWESGRTQLTGPADLLLRVLYQAKLDGHKEISDLLSRISQLNRQLHQSKVWLEETASGWKQAA